jgi:nicotinamide-nucleotide amidase
MPVSAVITIGNEILLGRTLNTNLAYLARELASLGVPVELSLTVRDEPGAILSALRQSWDTADIVITTGGLGPTDDDITKKQIAEFFGVGLEFDDKIWTQVRERFAARNMPTPEVNRNQALVPAGFTALKNELGTAPGLYYNQNGKLFFAFAGVPREMSHVFDTQAKPLIRQAFGAEPAIYLKTLRTFGIAESALAELLSGSTLPSGVTLAWLPQTGRVDLRFYGPDRAAVDLAAGNCLPLVAAYVWGEDDDTPAEVLHQQLRKRGMDISMAESCTGGLLQKMFTDVAGASDLYPGGVVSYANFLKENLLGVSSETLITYGAVSVECALEMVRGIKNLTHSATAISVTGVAGPDGGTIQKPVGTVSFGFSVLNQVWSTTQIFSGDRDLIRFKAAEYALLHLAKYLQGIAI